MDHAQTRPPGAAAPAGRTPRAASRVAILVLACGAQFMVVLDVSVVNVALPAMQAALGFDALGLQWVVNGYALVFAGFLLLGARLADLYGRSRIFVLGLALFSGSSLVGGLAGTPGMLIAARAVQGLGAAVLAPATLTILTTSFPEGSFPEDRARTRAMAIWTAVGVGGGAAGNLLGGLLTEYLSWRWILLINVPIGAVAIGLAAVFLVGKQPRHPGTRLDVPGAVVVTAGLGALTYGVTQTHSRGWSDPVTVAALALGIVALAMFLLIEARFTTTPLIPLRLLRVRTIARGNVLMLLTGACLIPMWYFLSLFMQHVLQYGALRTGAGFLPHTLVTMIVGWRLTPRLMRHVDARRLIIIGATLAASGFLWQSRITPDSGYLSGILGPAIVMSTGCGLLITPLTTTVTAGSADADAGAASGLMNTSKQIGGAIGLAVLVTVAESPLDAPAALTDGYARAFLAIAVLLGTVAVLGLALPAGGDRPPGRYREGTG